MLSIVGLNIYKLKAISLSLTVMGILSFPEFVEVELTGLGSLRRRCECITYFGSSNIILVYQFFGLLFLFVWPVLFWFGLSLSFL